MMVLVMSLLMCMNMRVMVGSSVFGIVCWWWMRFLCSFFVCVVVR